MTKVLITGYQSAVVSRAEMFCPCWRSVKTSVTIHFVGKVFEHTEFDAQRPDRISYDISKHVGVINRYTSTTDVDASCEIL
jgi:hypothetical protein